MQQRRINTVSVLFAVVSALVWLLSACAESSAIFPQSQRIIVLRQNVPLYQYPDRKWVQFLRQGDTLYSCASRILADESGKQRHFLVKTGHNGELAFVNSDLGKSVETEYELLARSCDTDFLLSRQTDSIAWERAVRYVERHSPEAIERCTSTLIQTGKRLRTDALAGFTIRRTFETDGTRYRVRSGNNETSLEARRCALFIQTGKSEEDFSVVDSVASK